VPFDEAPDQLGEGPTGIAVVAGGVFGEAPLTGRFGLGGGVGAGATRGVFGADARLRAVDLR
jgi:hypothetical protein